LAKGKGVRGSGDEGERKPSMHRPIDAHTVTMDDGDEAIRSVFEDDPVQKAAGRSEAKAYEDAGLGSGLRAPDLAAVAARERAEEAKARKSASSRTQLGRLELHEHATAWAKGLGISVDPDLAFEVTKSIGPVPRHRQEDAVHDWVQRYKKAAVEKAADNAYETFEVKIDDGPAREWREHLQERVAKEAAERDPASAARLMMAEYKDKFPAPAAVASVAAPTAVPAPPPAPTPSKAFTTPSKKSPKYRHNL
jgi:hypothetical protein